MDTPLANTRAESDERADDAAYLIDRTERSRRRLRAALAISTSTWLVSLLWVDRASMPWAVASVVRGGECAAALAGWWWLARPRPPFALSAFAVGFWSWVAALQAYGLLHVTTSQLPVKVASISIAILLVCAFVPLAPLATFLVSAATLAMLGVLALRGETALMYSALTLVGGGFALVSAFSWARERGEREEHRVRRALGRANDALAHDQALLRRLFVNLSHDLRTPLAVIRAELELAKERASEPSLGLDRALANAETVTDLVDQLLELARLDAGQVQRVPVALDLASTARAAAALVPSRTGECPSVIAHGEPWVRVDRAHLQRMLQNLLGNARRHGGDDVRIELGVDGEGPWLDVSDGGVGVPPELRASIFERFVSLATDGEATSGIGLPLVAELAAANGGSVTLLEAPRTTFRLRLPLAAPSPSLPPSPHDERSAGTKRTTLHDPAPRPAPPDARPLLVVEDHAALRAVIRESLGDAYALIEAPTLADANAALTESMKQPAGSAIAAVLCDVMLPDGNGVDWVHALRADPRHATLPIVVLSALGAAEARARGIALGADDYLAKPFSPMELRARLARAVSRADARRLALEEQRRALLMEIHDGVSGSLARAALALPEASDPAGMRARRAVLDAVEEARQLMTLVAAEDEPWTAWIADARWMVGELTEGAGLTVEFRATDDASAAANAGLLRADLAHVLSRVLRESITNVQRHARARRLVIEAAADAERFSLSIEDDGVGLGGASPGRGLGFMRRRLAHVGGQLVLGPSRGFATGLRVEASVPRAPSPVDAAAAAHGEFVLGQRPAGD